MSTQQHLEVDEKEPTHSHLYRVKVYRLNENGNWDDKGTGLITIQNLEKSAALGLVVMDEEQPSKPLLIHRMSKDQLYQLQDATIIFWQDAEAASDIAISFQEADSCKSIWDEIQQEQNRNGVNPYADKHHMIDEMDGRPPSAEPANGYAEVPLDLPTPELGNLPAISEALRSLPSVHREDTTAKWMKDPTVFVGKLLDCFRTAEDLEDTPSLQECYHIVKALLMLIDTDLLEVMFAEQNVMNMIGALEYDPNLREKAKYREFLRDVVVFKEPVPLSNSEIRSKIHQTYRIGYVRDVILPRSLDESAYSTLSSFIIFNNVDILNAIIDEKEFFQDLTMKFRTSKPGSETWTDIISFLSELATLSKHLQLQNQVYLFDVLVSLGLFEILTSAIKHGNEKVQGKATDVLLTSLQYKPSLLRDYLTGPLPKLAPQGPNREAVKPNSPLFDLLIGFLTNDSNSGLQEQVVEILRNLLGSADFERNDFLNVFYDAYMPQLMTVIERGCDKSLKAGEGPTPQALNMVLEILCYCVYNHQCRIKYYILRQEVFEKVIKVLQRKERWLVCAAIRFVRTCLSHKDNFYNRYIARINLFEPIITVFVENGEKYNLLNSVVLEMFSFIHQNGIRNLIDYFMESQYQRVEDVDYDKTFLIMKTKWDQMRERPPESAHLPEEPNAARRRKDPRALDREEESYFDEGEDDEPVHTEGIVSGVPLVDYDDEDWQSPKGPQIDHKEADETSHPEKRMRFMDQRAALNFQPPAEFQPHQPPPSNLPRV